MSGICAIIRLDGREAHSGDTGPILAGLAARGPDRTGTASDGPAALGHALNATTPEAVIEPAPLRHASTGCIVTADVRLDDRPALIAALGLQTAGRVIGDGELILAAYLRWGLDCPDRLLGDFAFVLWDPRRRRLFAARDKAGMRQLTYHMAPGRLFACATDPEALVRHPDVPRRIDEARVADFLEQFEAIDHTSTFFADVLRLPPAHALVVEGGTLRTWRYWQIAPPAAQLRLGSDADYAAALRDVLGDAVRARLRSPGPVGAMLSGGMDSGSVTAIAARQLHTDGAAPLPTFSAVDTDPACKESACVRASLAAIPHIAPHVVSLGEPERFRDEVIRLTRTEADPFDGHMAMIRAIYLEARRAGLKVMLDGVSGDTTLGTGDMVGHHLAHGRIAKAWAEARAQERNWGDELGAARTFKAALKREMIPDAVRRWRRDRWERLQAAREAADSIVDPALAARIDLPARRRANALHVAQDPHCGPLAQAQRPLHPYAIVGRERYDRVAGALGIEPRDPFLDMRVIEFCLALPPDQLHAEGWPKMILRRAMAGMLPDAVRWKRGRDHVGWRFSEVCTPGGADTSAVSLSAALGGYVSFEALCPANALQCSQGRVVTERDLGYLGAWITFVNSF